MLLKQKKAVGIIARADYLDHTEKSFYNMKLLTVNQIIELRSLTFMYEAFNGQLPLNLQTHFNLNTGKKRYQDKHKCQFSRQAKKQHCLAFIGVKLWNKTVKWIMKSNNIRISKKKYDNYIIQTHVKNSTYSQIHSIIT